MNILRRISLSRLLLLCGLVVAIGVLVAGALAGVVAVGFALGAAAAPCVTRC